MLSHIMSKHIPVAVSRMRKRDFIANEERLKRGQVTAITEGSGWRDVSACPVCGSMENSFELEVSWAPLVRCQSCELRYHTRIPVNFGDLYQDTKYTTHGMGESLEHFNYRKTRFGSERVELLQRHVGNLANKTLLDVGCGMGDFLAAAQGHFKECLGSEFSDRQRELARANTGMAIFAEPLEGFPRRDLDIITAFDVIEHVPDPKAFMEAASNLLVPGGHVLLYTPNFDSFSIRVMRETSSLISPGHIQLFSHNALTVLGDRTGFDVVHFETRGLDFASIMSHMEFMGQEVPQFLMDWSEDLQAVLNESQAADYLRVIYRRK